MGNSETEFKIQDLTPSLPCYHPGVPHHEWYAKKILRLESEMLKSAAKP